MDVQKDEVTRKVIHKNDNIIAQNILLQNLGKINERPLFDFCLGIMNHSHEW